MCAKERGRKITKSVKMEKQLENFERISDKNSQRNKKWYTNIFAIFNESINENFFIFFIFYYITLARANQL